LLIALLSDIHANLETLEAPAEPDPGFALVIQVAPEGRPEA